METLWFALISLPLGVDHAKWLPQNLKLWAKKWTEKLSFWRYKENLSFEKLKSSKQNLQVDVDELEDLAASQEVKAMPTFAFFKGGKKLESFAGANEARIRETIEKLLAA